MSFFFLLFFLGITREPNFISKRRVPYHNPQISKSFEWTGDCDSDEPVETEALKTAELCADHRHDVNQEKTETTEGPRLPPKVWSHSSDSGVETALALAENSMKKSPPVPLPKQKEAYVSPKKQAEKMNNGLHGVLQRKAGMNIPCVSTFPRNSEYRSQFIWKSPHEKSPILAAEEALYNMNKPVPPFKSPAITSETANVRHFKDSPAAKGPQEERSEEREFLVDEQTKREELFQKPAEDASKQGKSEQKHPKRKNKQHVSQKPLSLRSNRGKMNTEYRSKFLSPAQYFYKDGAWSRIRSKVPNQASQNSLNSMWYMEPCCGQVRELRARAKAYRQRIEGTHFSRYHLNQILSDNNSLWDVSSDSSSEEGISNDIRALDLAGVTEKESAPRPKMLQQPGSREQSHQDDTEKKDLSDVPTVPVKRRLVWGEQEGTEEKESRQSTEEEEEKENEEALVVTRNLEKNNKDIKEDNRIEGENTCLLNSPAAGSDSSSVSSEPGGRLPTPKLRALGRAQRTHHDLTTPAVGGAILVSPPKFKSSSSQQRMRSLGTDPSSVKQGAREASQRKSFRVSKKTDSAMHFRNMLLKHDQWHPNGVSGEEVATNSANQEQSSAPPVLKSTKNLCKSCWSPSPRIQGTLKDPEFQHNEIILNSNVTFFLLGNVGNPKMRSFQLPLQERNYNNEERELKMFVPVM
ncbi:hypothetical protein ASZ78_002942 [Callipepla squamata]|uniref:Nuclear protein MDM1 n=1 Tax=Callipepla squamata TaxID=9009 RepID=A0A226MP84_CALSU|nr:hypothetical protein ASZ78_002942 [Callipepla squamata]